MSLQQYDITVGLNKTVEQSAQGRYFHYLSGTTPNITAGIASAAGNQAIKLTPLGGGASIVLMPGQSLRLPADEKSPSAWKITNYLNNEVITGQVLCGEGQFTDYNINAAVTLASTSVLNAAALPVQKQALATITNFAAVTINTGAAQALVSDPLQKILRIRNTHATAMLYLGGAGVTAATAGIVIPPGGMWIEEEAAGAAWYATSDTVGTNVAITGLKL